MAPVGVQPARRTRPELPPRAALVAGVAVLAVVPMAVLAAGSPVRPSPASEVVLAVGTLVIASLACLAAVRGRGERGLGLSTFRLGSVWVAYYALVFGITSLAWTQQQFGTPGIVHQSSVPQAILAATVGMVAATTGYVVGAGRWVRRVLEAVVERAQPAGTWALRTSSMPLLVYLVGLGARLVRLYSGQYAYLGDPRRVLSPTGGGQWLAQLEQFARYGLILAALDAVFLSRSLQSRVVFRILFVAEVVFALFSGVKGELLLTFLGVAVVYAVGGRGISRRAVTAAFLALLLVIPVNLVYREEIVQASSQGHSPLTVAKTFPTLVAETYGSLDAPAALADSVAFIARRLRQVDNLALVMQRTPSEIPHRGIGKLLYGPVVGLVPRAVWKDKPVLSTGYAFSQEYYNVPSNLYTSAAVTVPGDLYRHGGWAALVIGMGLLGAVLRLGQQVFYPMPDRRRVLFYVPFLVLLTSLEGDVVGLAVSLVQTLVVLSILSRLVFVRTTSTGT